MFDQRFLKIDHLVARIEVIFHQCSWLRWFHLHCTTAIICFSLWWRSRGAASIAKIVMIFHVLMIFNSLSHIRMAIFFVDEGVVNVWLRWHDSEWTEHAPAT